MCYIFAKKKLVKKPEVWYYDIHVQVVKYYDYFYIGQHYVNFIVYSLSQKSMYYVHVSQVTGKKNDQVCAKQVTFIEGTYIYKYIYIFQLYNLSIQKGQ